MNIFHSIDEFSASGKTGNVVTTGTFDGVHRGHRTILDRVCSIAKAKNAESVLLTFYPHPRQVLFPDTTKMLFLSTLEERKELLEKAGIQNLIIHPFTKQLSQVSAENYVRDILLGQLKTETLVIGYDHRFGHGRKGSIKELEEWGPIYGFNVEEMAPLKTGDVAISSTKIRNAVMEGDMALANSSLGYTYFITATVVDGMKIGSKELGYPTANLEVNDEEKLIPADGIYAVYVYLSSQSSVVSNQSLLTTDNRPLTTSIYKGMLSVGMNPTIENKGRSIEVNIFEFNENIYGKTIRVGFYKKIRNEEKFNSLAELKAQLDKDKEVCLGML
jgi:riboflavin kinase/FMN adenylyltransferase